MTTTRSRLGLPDAQLRASTSSERLAYRVIHEYNKEAIDKKSSMINKNINFFTQEPAFHGYNPESINPDEYGGENSTANDCNPVAGVLNAASGHRQAAAVEIQQIE